MKSASAARRRTVASRVLLSYAILLTAFGLVGGYSVIAQRHAARASSQVRTGYLPLSLALRGLVANQDNWNTQLNHITTARNPADKRLWFDTALSIGRPKKFGEVRAKITRAFVAADAQVGYELLQMTNKIEAYLRLDQKLIVQLFDALDQRDEAQAEKLRDRLVTRGLQARKRLSRLEQRVEWHLDRLMDAARARERLTIQLVLGLMLLTILVGVLAALHTRRLLRPLAAVTARAKAVARGDLTPRKVVASNDEIGELAATFEGMVGAIKRANEQLVVAERLATAGKMAAHLTHEIRNPLSSIALNLELMEDELPRDGEARQLLRAISKELDRLSALSQQYLSFARQQPLSFQPEDPAHVVEEACHFMQPEFERHHVKYVLEVEPDLPPTALDESQLRQAIFNVLRNAREAMPDGGQVIVRVYRSGDWLKLVIEDEGCGLDEQAKEHLFEPFFTTKSHGTGLGVAITRQIIEGHGGTIVYHNRSPVGTSVEISLPLSQSPQGD